MRRIVFALALAFVVVSASPASATEICGDGLDNDSDSMADEQCFPGGAITANPLSESLTGTIAPKLGSVVYTLPPDFDPHVAYGPPLRFQRVYLSHYQPGTGAGYRNPFGNMWHHNYLSWLDKNTTPNPDTVIVHLPNGREVLFTYASTGGGYDTYTPQTGAHVKWLRQSTSTPFQWELRTLTGETYVYDWSSPTGKLIAIRDTLATPNAVTISYDGSGRVQYVTDAQGTKRFKLSYNGSSRLTKVEYQTIAGGTPTTRSFADFTYNNNQLSDYQPNSGVAQQYTYASSKLTLIEDDAGNDLISYSYVTGTAPTAVARLKSSHGELGFEYGSSRAACSGGTVVFFNRKGTTACDSDADCGAGLLCGGQTDPSSANTGVCYRAARCLQFTSPHEDLVTTVTPLGPPSESCEGACTDVAEYAWNTTGVVDLKGVKDPNSKWTSYSYNANGLPTKIVYADSDNDASNGGGLRTLYLAYGDSNFPGRVTESRRQSDIKKGGTCTDSDASYCQQTLYSYSSDGLLASRQEKGYTLNSSGSVVAYDHTTSYSYDSVGRLTQVNGPLSGSNDVTDFTYWSSTGDVLKEGQKKEIKRKRDSSTYLVTTLDDYDYWGNAKSVQVPDGTFTCMTFHADRNYHTQIREAMNGQTSCASSHASDLVTTYTRDKALRVTKVEHPAGGCTHREYDTLGRLTKIKTRDDCSAASTGDTQEHTYDDDGLLIKTEWKDASGTVKRRQEQTYFDSRRLATIINPVDTSKSTSITYNSRGFVDTIEAESSLSKTTYGYDDDDRVSSVTRNRATGEDDVWTLVHDWLAVLASVTDEDSKQIEDIHDDVGRKVKLVTPDSGTTLRLYNADGTLSTMIEPGAFSQLTHSYTSDNLRRPLTIDYSGTCAQATTPHAETAYVYDSLPSSGDGSCPSGMTCSRITGRLAYIKTTLLCSTAYGADAALDQETWYGYDDAGRLIREYIKDDTGRVADHAYEWTKNGALSKVTTPSSAVIGWTYGSAGSNTDQSKITEVWRTSTSTLIGKEIAWYPFGPLASYRHSNQISGADLRTVFSRNLAYRATEVKVETVTASLVFKTTITEDAKGRVTARDFTGGHANLLDSYFVYDKLDRVQCESAATLSSCPTSPDANTKNLHNGSPPFTASNDWKQFERPIPSYTSPTDWSHTVNLVSGKDQLSSIVQDRVGTTAYAFDARGNRTSDDNTSSMTHDARTYTYDGRRNAVTVSGQFYTGTAWHAYTMTSAFDARNRRVFKSFRDTTANPNVESQWFFYYDSEDRLTEIRWSPDTSDTSTYSVIQVFWLGRRSFSMWQTDYPAAGTKRVYLHTDETVRPVETYDWPASGDGVRGWAINPDAYGNDKCLAACSTFQQFAFLGQYRDNETVTWQDDGATPHRSALINNWHRVYDPLVGSYLQVDRKVDTTWDVYSYAKNNPVSSSDLMGDDSTSWDSEGNLYLCGDGPADPEYPGGISMECRKVCCGGETGLEDLVDNLDPDNPPLPGPPPGPDPIGPGAGGILGPVIVDIVAEGLELEALIDEATSALDDLRDEDDKMWTSGRTLKRCLSLVNADPEKWEAFCRSLPKKTPADMRVREGCWANTYSGMREAYCWGYHADGA